MPWPGRQFGAQGGAFTGAAVQAQRPADGHDTVVEACGPRIRDSQVTEQADLAGTAGVAALGMVIAAAAFATRSALQRRRMAAWQAGWRENEPHWSSRA